jgi:putative radical SAM enzyme (TIGR03279 family)
VRPALISVVAPGSPAARAAVQVGDELLSVSGHALRDVIEYRWLTDEADVTLELRRQGTELRLEIEKSVGEPLGIEVDSPVFDQVRTCDNHCEFCFIYQLPKGMRRSLYVKDDDFRLSFLYGNFTTLTRFTEADLERVVAEGLSPLHVSIHATDPDVRAALLRNRRGATSLRWLRALLDEGIEVHGQVVVCPGVNDGEVLVDTFTGVLSEYPELADVAVVPLGVSRFNTEARMRPHTRAEAVAVVEAVEDAQATFEKVLGHPMVHAADEYYLMAERPFPPAERYGAFSMHEDGIGMARAFEAELFGGDRATRADRSGFFQWVDGAPPSGYRAPRAESAGGPVDRDRGEPVGILTGVYGAAVLEPLLRRLGRPQARLVPVPNEFFGGNVSVTGLMVGRDVAAVLASEPEDHRYLLPDVCLNRGAFLDGAVPADLPRQVEVVATSGAALRSALEAA